MGGRSKRVVAVAFAILLLTSAAGAPIVGAMAVDETTSTADVSIDRSQTPTEQKQRALSTLYGIDPAPGKQNESLQRATGNLRTGLASGYLDSTRVRNPSVFTEDAEAIRALRTFRKTENDDATLRSAEHVVTADNESARQEVADAKAALQAYEGSLNHGERQSSSSHIENAEKSLAKAEAVFGNADQKKGKNGGKKGKSAKKSKTASSSPKHPYKGRAKAVVHYRNAWKQAHLALQRIDGATEPTVTFGTTIDPVWQDGQPDRFYLTGNYSDIVLTEPSNVTISIGNRTETTDMVSQSASPLANRTFRFEMNRTERVANVTVHVTDADAGQNGTATLPLDGDGLPAAFEHRVGSDPLDADSEIRELNGSQADNGLHDGAEVARSEKFGSVVDNATLLRPTPIIHGNDTDGDGISDKRERLLGTNATNNDTDSDGITDRYETNGGAHVDTDGDGKLDALEIYSENDTLSDSSERRTDHDRDLLPGYRDADDDGDGISTSTEYENSTSFSNDMDLDGSPNWDDSDADADGVKDGIEGVLDEDGDSIPAYFDNDHDNDGLPAFYERNVTKTGPKINDSDSAVTSSDESSDGVGDGETDFDTDGLPTHVEYRYSLDPFEADTDIDGLSDEFELRSRLLNATKADTDSDNISDGAEDPDNDTLSNSREFEVGTSITRNDTDADRIRDDRELANDTNPLAPDTDDDGLSDEVEPMLGVDPTNQDTDDDGVLDGEETFETTTTDEQTGVSVDFRGTGDITDGLSITPKPTYFADQNASAAPTVRLVNETNFTNATVRIPVDKSIPTAAHDDLAVYKWNGSSNDRWHRINSTVDNGTARATVDSFSYFTVLDTDEWVSATTISVAGTNKTREPLSFGSQPSFACRQACSLENDSTLVVGGEPNAQKIRVEQGNRTLSVVPLSNGQQIDEFYDYANYQINSPLPIAESDKSQLFFWSGPEGLSLVVVHDKPNDGYGGAVTMLFEGLPTDEGQWLVEDDSGDFVSETRADWGWVGSKTDGGVFRGGLTKQSVTIEPFFNEQANRPAGGPIDQWQLLTGRATQPRNHSLAMDAPVTIQIPEAPAENETNPSSGDTGKATFEHDLADGDELAVVYQTEQTDVDPNATITLTDESGTQVTESLNIGTVGTVEESIDTASLGEGTVTVAVAADGVNLRAQLVERLATANGTDSDGDGLSDYVEEQHLTLPVGYANTITLDPDNADTDDDGLEDGEEISVGTVGTSESLTVTAMQSSPATPDTDGDGLSDSRERKNTTIHVVDSQKQARKLVRDTASSNAENVTVADYANAKNVTSNPLVSDTDGDGANDEQEWIWGSNPRADDSDNDGLSDYEERAGIDEDPTMYDFRGPEINVQVSAWHSPQFTVDNIYHFNFLVDDPSGIDTVKIVRKGGTVHYTDEPGDTQQFYSQVIRTGAFASAGDNLGGTTFFVRAKDTHGNERQALALTRPNAIVQVMKDQGALDELGWGTASAVGFYSGFIYGAGELGAGIVGLGEAATSPIATAETVYDVAPYVLNHMGEVVNSAQDSFQRRQFRNNPYAANTPDNSTFASGFNKGYALYFVVEIYVTAGGAKALSGSGKAASAAKVMQTNGRALRYSYKAATLLYRGYKLPSKAIAWGLRKGIDAGGTVVRPILKQSGTISRLSSAQRRLIRHTPDGLSTVQDKYYRTIARYIYRAELADLDSDRLTRAGKLLNAEPERARQLLRRMDAEEQRAFLSDELPTDVRKNAYDGWKKNPEVTHEDVSSLSRNYRRHPDSQSLIDDAFDSVDDGEVLRSFDQAFWKTWNDLGSSQRTQTKALVDDLGTDGAKVVSRMDSDEFADLVKTSTRRKNFAEFYKSSDIDAEETQLLKRTLAERDGNLVGGSQHFANKVDSVQSVRKAEIGRTKAGETFDGVVVRSKITDDRLDEPLKVRQIYTDDGHNFVETHVEDQGWTLTDDGIVKGSGKTHQSEILGELGEEIDGTVVRSRGGEVSDGFSKDGSSEKGVDLVIKEEGGQVVIETKYYSSGGLSRKHLGEGYGEVQGSDAWLRKAIREQAKKGDISPELRNKLLDGGELSDDVEKRLIYVQNSDSPISTVTNTFIETISHPEYGGFDSVTIVKTGRQVKGVK